MSQPSSPAPPSPRTPARPSGRGSEMSSPALAYPSSPASRAGSAAGTPQQQPQASPAALSSPLSVRAATPRRAPPRGELNSARRRTVEQLQSDIAQSQAHEQDESRPADEGDLSSHDVARTTVIWGTNININRTLDNFRRFYKAFKLNETDAEAHYMTLLDEVRQTQRFNVNIDCAHLYSEAFGATPVTKELYQQLIAYPQEVIPVFDLIVQEIYVEKYPEEAMKSKRIQIRVFNLQRRMKMRDLNPSDIDHLVSLNGMVIRVTGIIPDLKGAFFKCSVCDQTAEVGIDRGRIEEPKLCSFCNSRLTMAFVYNRSAYADKQIVKMQETPESIPEGETPHTVNMCCFDDLVDVARPGDRVEVTGIYRAQPVRVNPRQRNVRSTYRTYLDVLHFRKAEKRRVSAEDASPEFANTEFATSFDERADVRQQSQQRVEELVAMSKQPDIYDRLVRSLAPGIFGLDDVKKGVLCQLFGGKNKSVGAGSFRGDINILLCGDPGTSKSQLLQYVHQLAPRGIYTSGKGSSAVGLTAYITKDPDTREIVLESGALVLSDRGICCIDEFDKMDDSTRSILHEAMEQQTVSIAKRGIICTLNARTSILASANPQDSKYNPRLSVVENIKLPPTLLSRFDLIYLILDKPNRVSDRLLAKHLVGLYYDTPVVQDHDIDLTLLTDYISYARKHVDPVLGDAAFDLLVKGYVDMRREGAGRHTITATPRQLESLIRLSEARARMRFSEVVDEVDVTEAIRLMKVALHSAAMDPTTGVLDMDLINTGVSASVRDRSKNLYKLAKDLLAQMKAPFIRFDELQRQLQERHPKELANTTAKDLRHAVDSLVESEEYYVTDETTSNPCIRKTK